MCHHRTRGNDGTAQKLHFQTWTVWWFGGVPCTATFSLPFDREALFPCTLACSAVDQLVSSNFRQQLLLVSSISVIFGASVRQVKFTKFSNFITDFYENLVFANTSREVLLELPLWHMPMFRPTTGKLVRKAEENCQHCRSRRQFEVCDLQICSHCLEGRRASLRILWCGSLDALPQGMFYLTVLGLLPLWLGTAWECSHTCKEKRGRGFVFQQ